MVKVFVKWGYTNDYGIAYKENAKINWFNTIEDAEAFINEMKEGNGSYFKLWKVATGDYNVYEKMVALYKEYTELKKLF